MYGLTWNFFVATEFQFNITKRNNKSRWNIQDKDFYTKDLEILSLKYGSNAIGVVRKKPSRKRGKWEILCAQIGDGEVVVYGVIITSFVSMWQIWGHYNVAKWKLLEKPNNSVWFKLDLEK